MSNPTPHPLLAAVRVCADAFDEITEVDPIYADGATREALLVELTRLSARVSALRAQVLAVSDDLADRLGARNTAAVLTVATRTSRREAILDERLGDALRARWTQVGRAAATGAVTWEQAGRPGAVPRPAPRRPGRRAAGQGEAHLIAEAGQFGPVQLRRLGRHVLEVVAPDIADAEEERALRAEERRARATTRLSFRPRGDGSTDLHARLPDPVASRLRAYLDAHTSPRRTATMTPADGDVDRLPLARRRGEAFCALLENVPSDGLPRHGGSATTVMVMIDIDTLRSGLGLAETSTGDAITAAEARRLACTAGILPVVLGGKGEVLDLGRSRRLFSPAQRRALAIRDRRCRAEGCDIPAAWCEAHHAGTLVPPRSHRPRCRASAVLVPPPPGPRPQLPSGPPPQRRRPLHPPDLRFGPAVSRPGVQQPSLSARGRPHELPCRRPAHPSRCVPIQCGADLRARPLARGPVPEGDRVSLGPPGERERPAAWLRHIDDRGPGAAWSHVPLDAAVDHDLGAVQRCGDQ